MAALGFHEMGLIYGLPLAVGLWLDARWQTQRDPAHGTGGRRPGVAAVGLLGAAVCCQLLIDRLPHADTGTIAHWFWSRFPHSEAAEWALYFYVAGTRGMKVALCQNVSLDPNYALHLACGLGVIAVAVLVFNGRSRRGWQAPLLAAVIPFVFLSAVAIDMSRWSTFAALNAWFVCASRPPGDGKTPGRWSFAARGLLLCALIMAASPRHLVKVGVATFAPAPLVDRLSWKLTGTRHSPSIAIGLRTCDPRWRELLELPDTAR